MSSTTPKADTVMLSEEARRESETANITYRGNKDSIERKKSTVAQVEDVDRELDV